MKNIVRFEDIAKRNKERELVKEKVEYGCSEQDRYIECLKRYNGHLLELVSALEGKIEP